MTDSMTVLERRQLANRIKNLSDAERKKFFKARRNQALFESVFNNVANNYTYKSGKNKGKVKVTELSRRLGLKKGGAISDALRGRRDFPKNKRLDLIQLWASGFPSEKPITSVFKPNKAGRLYNIKTGQFVKSQQVDFKPGDIRRNKAGRKYNKNTGRFV